MSRAFASTDFPPGARWDLQVTSKVTVKLTTWFEDSIFEGSPRGSKGYKSYQITQYFDDFGAQADGALCVVNEPATKPFQTNHTESGQRGSFHGRSAHVNARKRPKT